MMMDHDDELTPEEQRAFAALEKPNEPSRMLEERTVRALRAEGLLRARHRVSLPWLMAAAAAGAVLYLGGLATGQWLSNRETTRIVSDLERNHALEAAALVQKTGSAYAQAIAGLASLRLPSDSQSVVQGREVALSALYSAANQLVRLTPDDPLVVRILQVMEHEKAKPDTTQSAHTRRVIWF
jgi:hypothetical protein